MTQAARLFHICRRLQEGATVTVATLEEELEVARATIFRDMAVLRDQLNAPIVWDADRETYRLEAGGRVGPRFVMPGMWMEADELYGMLTVINLASALDPGVAAPFRKSYRHYLKKRLAHFNAPLYGLDRKIAVELPDAGDAAREAMSFIGPALMLGTPVRLHFDGLGESEGLRVIPQRLVLRPDGWWLEFHRVDDARPGDNAVEAVQLSRVVRAASEAPPEPDTIT